MPADVAGWYYAGDRPHLETDKKPEGMNAIFAEESIGCLHDDVRKNNYHRKVQSWEPPTFCTWLELSYEVYWMSTKLLMSQKA
jgi:hypothetical protein